MIIGVFVLHSERELVLSRSHIASSLSTKNLRKTSFRNTLLVQLLPNRPVHNSHFGHRQLLHSIDGSSYTSHNTECFSRGEVLRIQQKNSSPNIRAKTQSKDLPFETNLQAVNLLQPNKEPPTIQSTVNCADSDPIIAVIPLGVPSCRHLVPPPNRVL
jgi:hypothetical protein